MRIHVTGGILLIAAAVFCETTFAGPEIDLYSLQTRNTPVENSQQSAAGPVVADVSEIMAIPAFADPIPSSSDADLGSREHPMIPLPSSLWISLVMLVGVAVHVIRQQRTIRFH